MCCAMCCAGELQRAIRTVCVGCGCGLRCAVAVACSASSVPVAAVCIAAARAALARIDLLAGVFIQHSMATVFDPTLRPKAVCTVRRVSRMGSRR